MNRDATNRVNASIELFRSGDAQVCVQPTAGNEQPITIFIPAPLPEGFSGQGQDTNWVVSVFTNASDLAAIAEKGYDRWLMEDKVGINEPNGIYKVAVTIAAIPEEGPCYLVVGPHKMIVTEPGTYSSVLRCVLRRNLSLRRDLLHMQLRMLFSREEQHERARNDAVGVTSTGVGADDRATWANTPVLRGLPRSKSNAGVKSAHCKFHAR